MGGSVRDDGEPNRSADGGDSATEEPSPPVARRASDGALALAAAGASLALALRARRRRRTLALALAAAVATALGVHQRRAADETTPVGRYRSTAGQVGTEDADAVPSAAAGEGDAFEWGPDAKPPGERTPDQDAEADATGTASDDDGTEVDDEETAHGGTEASNEPPGDDAAGPPDERTAGDEQPGGGAGERTDGAGGRTADPPDEEPEAGNG
jgi:hypothetical protein